MKRFRASRWPAARAWAQRLAGVLGRLARCGLFRPRCRLCGADLVLAGEGVLCRECLTRISPWRGNRCRVCGAFLTAGPALCGPCRLEPPPYARHRSYAAYEGTLREVIILYKFGRVEPLKRLLVGLYLDTLERELPGRYDAVVPVPADRRRRREGFLPLGATGRLLARRLRIPFRPGWLRKARSTPPQVGLTRAQRLANLDNAFALAPGARVAGRRVLLIDDVTTTGTTLRRCAAALNRGGARVTAVTLGQAQP